ncbi:MAG: two-component regulator propeller domain-containing protein [Adhaeribacter sp.]
MAAFTPFLLLLLVFCSFLPSQAQHLNLRPHPINQTLGITNLYHSLQDAEGFRWFGTETGVVRFDGNTYRRFTLEDGLADNEVLKIYQDSRKRIWFLSFNGHLSYYHKGKFYNARNSALLRQIGAISTFSFAREDQKGGIFFSGYQNKILYIAPDNTFRVYNLEHSQYDIGPTTFYEDARGQQYLVSKLGFLPFGEGRLRPPRFRYAPVQAKARFSPRPQELYFVAREGLVHMQDTLQKLIIPAQRLPEINQANLIFTDSNQRLWIASNSAGIFMLKDYLSNKGAFKKYLKNAFITSVSEDKESNVWFTTTGEGVFILPANAANTLAITTEEGLSNNKVNALALDHQGYIWLGLDNGKLARYKNGSLQEYDINFSDKYNRVTNLLVDRQDNIWCGTDLGMVQMQKQANGTYRQVLRPYHLDGRFFAVKSISPDPTGRITFVHAAGIEKFRDRPDADGYFVSRVPQVERIRTYTHFHDRQGHLWYSNIKGLHQIRTDGVHLQHWQRHPALRHRFTDIEQLPQGILVLATYGHGIFFMHQGRIIGQVNTKSGLSSNICRKLFVRDSTIWVATNAGLNRFTYTPGKQPQVRVIRSTDGLLADDILSIQVHGDQVYLGSSQGLNILHDIKQQPRQSPPPLLLTEVKVDGRNLRNQQRPRLRHGQNRVQFEFIGITFQDIKNISYQYRLKEINPAWTSTTNTNLEFSALQPGDYTFEVKTRKHNSNWSAPLRYEFVIAPPFWKTWWFLGLLALVITALVTGGTRLYIVLKLRQQKRRLETDYRLQQERERIARDLHDNVGSNLAYIINSLEDLQSPAKAPSPANTNAHHDLREFTKQTITQLRETIWAIRQDNITIRELGTKIQKLIWQLSSHRPDFEYEVNISGNQDAILTPVQALNLFRIAQEALNNVFKHSQSACLLVSLQVNPRQQLELKLEDKGIGFDPGQQNQEEQYGLNNMQERARELGAYFRISSLPGRGTLIYLRVNLKDQKN